MVQGREVEVVKLICGTGKEKGKYWVYKWRWWSEDGANQIMYETRKSTSL